MFATYYNICSQKLPQCCKYLNKPITDYLLYLQNIPVAAEKYVIEDVLDVDDENFIQIKKTIVLFCVDNVNKSNPAEIEQYVDLTRITLSDHDKTIMKLLARDRWYKGDFVRLKKILIKSDVANLITFACNVMWERGYENNYTLGQQLSIRITTKLIQSGLDFKHQNNENVTDKRSRGWNDKFLEKLIQSISSMSDVIKRHRCAKKYIVLELVDEKSDDIKRLFVDNQFIVIENANIKNICAIQIDDDKNSYQYLQKFSDLIQNKIVNVLFVTDVEYYLKTNNYAFYLYSSLKLYYYCLKSKFVFETQDYEIIFLLNLIISLEWHNGGHLNSFTLEKSHLYNPLELSTRRLNSIKRSAAQARIVTNDNEIKIDFIKGKRIKTGSHQSHQIVNI
ncbi:P47 [Adoxophyes orana nucleopolyhedrovirus]|uniref:P47 n=1 Tax=Adoxophyes orana nucleopolyhedrovirus TaxID=542343 RepID=UPI0001829BDB|nr:P47 [Adoxophyes orana nucleopolyhedrovirus]ACF05302.1 P47 [Adoxophyes orana nucleopolyhedrovirus]